MFQIKELNHMPLIHIRRIAVRSRKFLMAVLILGCGDKPGAPRRSRSPSRNPGPPQAIGRTRGNVDRGELAKPTEKKFQPVQLGGELREAVEIVGDSSSAKPRLSGDERSRAVIGLATLAGAAGGVAMDDPQRIRRFEKIRRRPDVDLGLSDRRNAAVADRDSWRFIHIFPAGLAHLSSADDEKFHGRLQNRPKARRACFAAPGRRGAPPRRRATVRKCSTRSKCN